MYSIENDSKIQILTSVVINVPPAKVWNVLSEIRSWKNWTQFIASFEGDFKKDGQIKVVFNTPEGQVPFERTLVIFEENKALVWEGEALWPGSKDHHVFYLEEIDKEKTLFTQADGFHGIERTEQMAEAEKQMEGLYMLMNEEFKKYVENNV